MAISDSSFQLGNRAAAWTIKGSTAQHQIKGAGQTPGSINDQSTYCSELFGLWGTLYLLKRFMDEFGIKQGQVLVACDGLSALWKAKAEAITELQEKHYDLISTIRHLRWILPLTLIFHHMKGHQDWGQTTVLTQEAWMNIQMDEEAKQKVSTNLPTDQQYQIPYEGWMCLRRQTYNKEYDQQLMNTSQWPNYSKPLGNLSMLQKQSGKTNQLRYGGQT